MLAVIFFRDILLPLKYLVTDISFFSVQQLRSTGALVITAFLDFLTFALCAPYSETTDGQCFDSLLEMVANEGRVIFRLFQVGQTFSCTRKKIALSVAAMMKEM